VTFGAAKDTGARLSNVYCEEGGVEGGRVPKTCTEVPDRAAS
jgi:hypothetical protein